MMKCLIICFVSTDVLLCHIRLPACLWIMYPSMTTDLQRKIQAMEMRCYCKILRTSYKDHVINAEIRAKIQQANGRRETHIPFIRSGQNYLARHSEREEKTRQTEKKVGRQHQGMDRPGVRQVPEGSGEQRKMEATGCEVSCRTG